MSVSPAIRLRTPEEIALQAGADLPRLRLPQRNEVFAARALRLRELAAGHAMRDYLLLLAVVCEAQHRLLQDHPATALPTPAQADDAARHGRPLLDAAGWRREALWRDRLRTLLDHLLTHLSPDNPARAGVQAVRAADDAWLEQQADRLLGGIMRGLDLAAAPLIAAALQLHWTQLVIAIHDAAPANSPAVFGPMQDSTRCPCCGSLPAASITRIGGEADGYRYLHCALCSAEWHMVRVKCTHCEGTRGIHYEALQPVDGAPAAQRDAVQAECCDSCGHYLKIIHMARELQAEPLADDLATLTLDLLVSQAGFARHGVNLLLLFGDPEADDTAAPRTDGGDTATGSCTTPDGRNGCR